MNLISSREALDFFAQAAPRPWVCRTLCWMITQGEIDAYFNRGLITASASRISLIIHLLDGIRATSGPEVDAIIDEEFDPEFAAKLKGKEPFDKIQDEPYEWIPDAPEQIDPGYFMFWPKIDWEIGTLEFDFVPDERDLREMFFPSGDFFYSEFEKADYAGKLEGFSFSHNEIEMMLPTFEMRRSGDQALSTPTGGRPTGRPQKWDWDGAFAYIIAQAQKPDGLPTGHGAQAQVEAMMAEWFEHETGASPVESQIRKRASPCPPAVLTCPIRPE